MKFYPVLIAFLLSVTAAAHGKIELGDDLETALERLGKPIGTIELRDKTLLLYPQGEIALREVKITEIDLMSDEEFAADQERIKQEREEWQMAQERRAIRHTEEGKSIKADKLSSSAFAALPAKDRVDYWRSFQIRYTGVDVSDEIGRALESYQTELAELETQQRIAELEARVAQAEKEATTAKLETEKLKDQALRSRSSTRYGLRYYYDPVTHPRYLYRPPTVTIFTNGNQQKTQKQAPDYWKFRDYNPEGTAERVARILQDTKEKVNP
ncbi:MAG: hypothetical protein AAF065_04270 [Verrucomicrobiota bacterium]